MNSFNNILWIFSAENPMSIPSYIVGGIMPADYLKIQKVIFLKKDDPIKFLSNHKPKIIILGKAFHSGIYELAKEAKKNNIKIISIFDDWHFENNNKLSAERSELNLKLSNISEVIISKTKASAQLIFEKTNIKTNIIPDCIRYKTMEPINDINFPFKICWFGNYTNHKTITKGLEEIKESNQKVNLKIITNKIEKIKLLTDITDKNISINFLEWSIQMHEYLHDSDIVVLPLINNKNSYVKSSNIIVDSLNMGRFVIINDNTQFSEFKDYCYFVNIGDGLKWAIENKKIAKQMVTEGQQYVLQKYNLNNICNKWKKIFEEISS